jgi:hypothetical protein
MSTLKAKSRRAGKLPRTLAEFVAKYDQPLAIYLPAIYRAVTEYQRGLPLPGRIAARTEEIHAVTARLAQLLDPTFDNDSWHAAEFIDTRQLPRRRNKQAQTQRELHAQHPDYSAREKLRLMLREFRKPLDQARNELSEMDEVKQSRRGRKYKANERKFYMRLQRIYERMSGETAIANSESAPFYQMVYLIVEEHLGWIDSKSAEKAWNRFSITKTSLLENLKKHLKQHRKSARLAAM